MSAVMTDCRSESAPGTYRTCVTCQRRTPRDEMLDEYECQRCRQDYLAKAERNRINQDLSRKAKALGQAVNGMVASIGRGEFVPREAHIVYAEVLDNFGGVSGFAKLMRERYDAACNDEKPSHKVILDYFKAIMVLMVEAQKTQPPPPNCGDMTDEELGKHIAYLMEQKLAEMEEATKIAELPEEPEPLPEDRPGIVELLEAART